jgi:hypothetical protein
MWDFLTFRKMLIPILIQAIFWVGTIACVVVGLAVTAGSSAPAELTKHIGISGGPVLGGAIILLGPLTLRLYCELFIVMFRINDTLTEIRNNTRRGR